MNSASTVTTPKHFPLQHIDYVHKTSLFLELKSVAEKFWKKTTKNLKKIIKRY